MGYAPVKQNGLAKKSKERREENKGKRFAMRNCKKEEHVYLFCHEFSRNKKFVFYVASEHMWLILTLLLPYRLYLRLLSLNKFDSAFPYMDLRCRYYLHLWSVIIFDLFILC